MGYGKSNISIVLALIKRNHYKLSIPLPRDILKKINAFNKIPKQEPILIIMTKTLLLPWAEEIKKFYQNTLKFQIYYKDTPNFVLDEDTVIILTTPQVLIKYYKLYDLSSKIIHRQTTGLIKKIEYITNDDEPLLAETESFNLYSIKWSCLIIDEIQKFTNIQTKACQSIIAISSHHKFGLSGTMFDEPKPERILGYYKMLSLPFECMTVADTRRFLKKGFQGLQETIISRLKNEAFIDPIINKVIVEHQLRPMEEYIYKSLLYTLNTLIKIKQDITQNHLQNQYDQEFQDMLKGSILIVLQYLRQTLISPKDVALKLMAKEEIVSEIFSEVIKKLYKNSNNQSNVINHDPKASPNDGYYKDLLKETRLLNDDVINLILSYNTEYFEDYINNPYNDKSSRMSKVLETIRKHPHEKLIVFSCFRLSQNILNKYLKNRNILSLESDMTIEQRFDTIETFKKSTNSVLFLTYAMSAEGLNLQCAHTILLIDFWWSVGRSNQAIARILRYGQESPVVNIYLFTSNTGIEKGLFFKHEDKLSVLDELLIGPQSSTIRTLKTSEIIQILINSEENKKLLKKNNRC